MGKANQAANSTNNSCSYDHYGVVVSHNNDKLITRTRIQGIHLLFLAAMFPTAILLVVMYLRSMWPFGTTSMLLWDMEIQYINMYNWFHSVLHGEASLFYDFSKSLGGNMYGVFSTYLTSPINLLTFFFSPANMPKFITLATLLKIALSGFTCELYLINRFRSIDAGISVLLSCSYALCEYNIGLSSNLHFLDVIYMFPLLALATYRLVNYGRGECLSVCIGYTIVLNWYIGLMACISLVIYFVFELLLANTGKPVKVIKHFIAYAFLGGMMGSLTIVPSVLSSLSGKGTMSPQYLLTGFHCNPLDPIKGMLALSMPNTAYDQPAVFCGCLAPYLLLAGFFSSKISTRNKVVALIPAAIVFISFSFQPFETVLSAMTKTYSFHFRYSFVFSFFVIVAAAYFLNEVSNRGDSLSSTSYLLAIVTILVTLVSLKVSGFISWRYILFQTALVILTSLSMLILRNAAVEWAALSLCSLVLSVSLGANAFLSFSNLSVTVDEYSEYTSITESILSSIDEGDGSFYRIEKTFSEMDDRRGIGRPMATEGLTYNYNAITHYSSLIDSRLNEFLARMGYIQDNARAINYVDSNPAIDSVLGLRYLISSHEEPLLDYRGLLKGYPNKDYYLYENPYWASPIIPVSGSMKADWTEDPFLNQERLIRELLGEDVSIFRPVNFTETGESTWQIDVTDDGPVYAYFQGSHPEADLLVNGILVEKYFGRCYQNIACLGDCSPGSTLSIWLDEKGCSREHNLLVYQIDVASYQEALERIKRTSLQPTTYTDTSFVFKIDADSPQFYFLSIPYDDGWKATLDGEPIDIELAFDTFIGVSTPPGPHTVSLVYSPPFLPESIVLSVLASAVIALLWLKHVRRP